MNTTSKIVFTLFQEAFSRYSIDTSRIYLLGFSGGARVACIIALYSGRVRGVIACGAGFPATKEPAKHRFDFIGMAGNADFNMNEMAGLDNDLEKTGFRHALVVFDGKHEWPPEQEMEKAFVWNEFCAMKDKIIPANDDRIREFTSKTDENINKDGEQHNAFMKSQDLGLAIRFLSGLASVEKYRQMLQETRASGDYRRQEKHILELRQQEMAAQKMFTENYFSKDLGWWQERASEIELRISKNTDPETTLMNKRIISYLSLLSYMNYSSAKSAGDMEKADFAYRVYGMVDPVNAAKVK